MKKTKFYLTLLITLLSVVFISCDKDEEIEDTPDDGIILKPHDFECMPDHVFSQLPDTYTHAAFADINSDWTKAAEHYDASGPFSTMRFWGTKQTGFLQDTEEFLIEFYDGKPGEAGTTVIHKFNVSTSPIATGFFHHEEIFQIDVDFGTSISQLQGWVSVSRTTTPSNASFGWVLNYDSGPGGTSLTYYQGEWKVPEEAPNRQCFFCFGPVSDVTMAMPITN